MSVCDRAEVVSRMQYYGIRHDPFILWPCHFQGYVYASCMIIGH